jgi:hypothetical protein
MNASPLLLSPPAMPPAPLGSIGRSVDRFADLMTSGLLGSVGEMGDQNTDVTPQMTDATACPEETDFPDTLAWVGSWLIRPAQSATIPLNPGTIVPPPARPARSAPLPTNGVVPAQLGTATPSAHDGYPTGWITALYPNLRRDDDADKHDQVTAASEGGTRFSDIYGSAHLFNGPAIPAAAQDAGLQPPKTLAIAERILNLAQERLWLDDLARDIVAARTSQDDLSFRLMPERLGPLDVHIGVSEAGLTLHLATQSDEAAKIIAGAQPRLVETLSTHGIRVAETHVGQGQSHHRGHQNGAKTPALMIEIAIPTPASPDDTKHSIGRYA